VHLPHPNFGVGSSEEEAYRDAIISMPISIIRLLAEMCQSDRGKSSCLTDGFLRRVLDKLHVLNTQLETNDTLQVWSDYLKTAIKSRFEEDKDWQPSLTRRIVCQCIRVIERCANFTSIAVGSSNDLILDTSRYDVTGILKGIVEKEACPKADPAYLFALQALAKLAEDTVRLDENFSKIDILGLVRTQMSYVGTELPESGVHSCLRIIKALASGHPNDYKLQQFFQFREVLGKVTQNHTSLQSTVRNVTWEMFISSEKASKNVHGGITSGSSSKLEAPQMLQSAWNGETFDYENDVILKEILQKMFISAGLTEESNALSSRQTSRQSSRNSSRQSSRHSSRNLSAVGSSRRTSFDALQNPATDEDVYRAVSGTYDACGVTGCGSLKLANVDEHGKFRRMAPEKLSSLLLNVSQMTNGVTNIAKLSAREPDLRNLILERKARSGFVDKIKSPIKDNRQKKSTAAPGSPSKAKLQSLQSSIASSSFTATPAVVSVESAPELRRTRPPIDNSGPFIC